MNKQMMDIIKIKQGVAKACALLRPMILSDILGLAAHIDDDEKTVEIYRRCATGSLRLLANVLSNAVDKIEMIEKGEQ